MNDNRFYVYVLLDTRYKKTYKFNDLVFDYKPFYVGKGVGHRYRTHFNLNDKSNTKKSNKISKIIKSGNTPISLIIYSKLTEINAYEIEKQVISKIGLLNLTNIDSGGKGRSSDSCKGEKNNMYGKKRPQWIIDKMQEARQKTNTIDKKNKKLEEIWGEEKAKLAKQKMSENRKGKTWDEYYGAETANRLRELRRIQRTGYKHSEETKQKMRESYLKRKEQ